MSTTPTSERTPDTSKPGGRNLRWLWIVALIAVIAIAGVVLWLVISNGDEEPAITFDGTTATYSGPTTLEAGAITFSLTNTHENAMDFGRTISTDPDLTLEEVKAWLEANPNPEEDSPWFGGYDYLGIVMTGQTIDWDTTFPEGTYVLLMLDQFTHIPYPASVIDVTAG